MITYKVKSKTNDDPVIEKSGDTTTFSVSLVKQNEAALEKIIKELTAQSGLEGAKMNNIERNHPHVLKRSPEEMNAISMYYESYKLKKSCDDKLKEAHSSMRRFKKEKKEILKQTGIEL